MNTDYLRSLDRAPLIVPGVQLFAQKSYSPMFRMEGHEGFKLRTQCWHVCQVHELKDRVLVGKHALGFHHLPNRSMKAFNRVSGVNQGTGSQDYRGFSRANAEDDERGS